MERDKIHPRFGFPEYPRNKSASCIGVGRCSLQFLRQKAAFVKPPLKLKLLNLPAAILQQGLPPFRSAAVPQKTHRLWPLRRQPSRSNGRHVLHPFRRRRICQRMNRLSANQSTVKGSSLTKPKPSFKNCSTSASLPGLDCSRTNNDFLTIN